MNSVPETRFNTIVRKYPSHRDEIIKGYWKWLKGRRADDNAEGLWRIHDKLYDLTEFIDRHPGGKEWLDCTKGIDITEGFEAYHLTTRPSKILKKYYVHDAKEPRNYLLTYNEDGFFKTIKRKVVEKLKTMDVHKESQKSPLMFDLILFGLLFSACASVWFENYIIKMIFVTIAGVFGAFMFTGGHNFLHMKNNWRMYGCHVFLMNFRESRVIHAISHHLYPNSICDFEVIIYEPFYKFLPVEKSKLRIILTYLIAPVVHLVAAHAVFFTRIISFMITKEPVFFFDDLIGFCLPLIMLLIGKAELPNYIDSVFNTDNLLEVFILWNLILVFTSLTFNLIALNAGHHGSEIVHEGDEFKSLDFGIYQCAATIDRYGANSNAFMAFTHYGYHILHHLFPTIDHTILHHFEDELAETCQEFYEDLRKITMFRSIFEHFKQLARTKNFKLKNQRGDAV